MVPFDFQPQTRIVFGPGKIESLGEIARELPAQRALVVSDRGVVSAGHTARGLESLERAGVATQLFDALHENPNTDDVAKGVSVAQEFRPDLIVGLGGGSSMDCAKGINFIYTNGGEMKDYWGIGKANKPMLPMIAVPTTSGTGSETQSFALISDAKTHVKMACGDKKASCRVALLDPELTVTQPTRVTALTGIDAISHALETFVTRKRNLVSLAFSREAWRMLAGNLARVIDHPTDLDARSAMQLGSCLAGLAIENSMLGATHALANPLTSVYGIPHGQAIGVLLPHVVRFNGEAVGAWYRDLLGSSTEDNGLPPAEEGCEGMAGFLTRLVSKAGLATRLRDLEVEEARLPELATDAAKQWTATFNPRTANQPELLTLYRHAY
jgi:alcohol dehydrogenase